MQNKIISVPKFFGEPDMHGQALQTCTKWSVIAVKKDRRIIPEILLQVAGYLCCPQFCLRVAVQGESDWYCQTEDDSSENDCPCSRLVCKIRTRSKHLNFQVISHPELVL